MQVEALLRVRPSSKLNMGLLDATTCPRCSLIGDLSSTIHANVQVEALLRARPSSKMNMGLMDRLREEWQFNQDSLKGPQ